MTLGEACVYYAEQEPRGEYVLVLEGTPETTEESITEEAALAMVQERMDKGMSRKDAVKEVSKLTGFPKNSLYEAALR